MIIAVLCIEGRNQMKNNHRVKEALDRFIEKIGELLPNEIQPEIYKEIQNVALEVTFKHYNRTN